jgi:hypothetical protein
VPKAVGLCGAGAGACEKIYKGWFCKANEQPGVSESDTLKERRIEEEQRPETRPGKSKFRHCILRTIE